jgi:hypothetical protein
MQWLAVNAFLIVVACAGAGAFWLLGNIVKLFGVTGELEWFGYMLAATGSIFTAYYAGKLLYGLIDRSQ